MSADRACRRRGVPRAYPAQTEPSRPRPVVVRNTKETESMGLLDNIFGGGQQTGRGGASPLTLALLALLAYRTYQGKGRLADMLGRGQGNPSGYGQGNDGTGTSEASGRV